MAPARCQLLLEVINHEEYVEIERPPGGSEWQHIEGSRTAFLNLRAPDGSTVRAEIPHDHLDHLLAFMFPDLQEAPTPDPR